MEKCCQVKPPYNDQNLAKQILLGVVNVVKVKPPYNGQTFGKTNSVNKLCIGCVFAQVMQCTSF